MPEIKVKISGDNSGFNRAMKDASSTSRAFAGEVKSEVAGVTDVLTKVAGGSGFGKLASLLGAGGLAGAAVSFGVALVGAVKGGVDAFEKLETAQARASAAFGSKGMAFQLKEWAKQNAGSLAPEDLVGAATAIKEGGGKQMSMEEAQTRTMQLRGAAAYTGSSLGEMADLYAKGLSHDFTNLGRMFRSNSGLREIFKEDLPEVPDLDKAATKGEITPEMFNRVLAKESAPGGAFAQARQEQGGTLSVTVAKLQVAIGQVEETIGEGLAPALKALTADLTKDLGGASAQAKIFGEAIGKGVENIEKILHSPAIEMLLKAGGAERGVAMQGLSKIGDFFNGTADIIAAKFHDTNQDGSAKNTFKEMKDALHQSVFNLKDTTQTLKDVVNPQSQ